jgi:ADP-heptose:LPS heptosyltransferase
VKKVLIIQTAFLGDVILATPLALTLKANFPACEIHFLVKKGNESLLENHEAISKVWVFDKSKGKIKNIIRLGKTFRKENFDIVLNLHRFASSGLIAKLSKGKQTYGFKKNPLSSAYTASFPHEIGNGQHEVDRNLSILKELKLTEIIRRPALFPSPQDFDKVQEYVFEKYYCLAPASIWFTKQLPKEKWVELVKILIKKGKVYLIGSPSDKAFCEEIIQMSGENAINLAGEFSLLQSAALMKNASRSYVNDSGPLHLASAVNASVTAFFCSTVPAFGFGPLSEDSLVLETKENLSCRPCGLHGFKICPEKHFKCGEIQLDFANQP